jgi:iron complex outermembrane receptor protein
VVTGHWYGGEILVSAHLASGLDAGCNYTLTKRDLDYAANPASNRPGADARGLRLCRPILGRSAAPRPSLDIASERWTLFIAPPLPRRSSIIAQAHT